MPVEVPRGGKMDWAPLRAKIATQGMRNSNVPRDRADRDDLEHHRHVALHRADVQEPVREIEPLGEFIVLNPFLVKDLKARGLWNQDMSWQTEVFRRRGEGDRADPGGAASGSAPRSRSRRSWLIDAAARRQKWIDQSQALNLLLNTPDLKTLSHMYRHAWHVGLKTTYYLRRLGASKIEKATVAPAACSLAAARAGEDCEACQ